METGSPLDTGALNPGTGVTWLNSESFMGMPLLADRKAFQAELRTLLPSYLISHGK